MKSAYELAMERLEKDQPGFKLTTKQKELIAQVESLYKAKLAEKELFLRDEISKAIAKVEMDQVTLLEDQLQRETQRLREECEAKKEAIRHST